MARGMTVAAVANLVGVSRSYINAEIQRGNIKASRTELPTGQFIYTISEPEVKKLIARRAKRASRTRQSLG